MLPFMLCDTVWHSSTNLALQSTFVYFQLAVDNDMGCKDSAAEFCTYMTEVLFMNGLFSLFLLFNTKTK